VYDQRDPATGTYVRNPANLTRPELDTEDKIRDHLLALFIPAIIAAYPGRYPPTNVHRWLGELSAYLDSNTPARGRSARVVDGRTLSGTDLILHELWPLAGSRVPRAVSAGIVSVLAAGVAVLMLTHVQIGFTEQQILGAVGWTAIAITALRWTWNAWPTPTAFDLRRLKTGNARDQLTGGMALGLAIGLGYWLSGIETLSRSLLTGVITGIVMGLSSGLTAEPKEYSIGDPRQIIRRTFTVGLAVGSVVGLTIGILFGLVAGFPVGIAVGIVAGLAVGPLGMIWQGFPVLRFMSLLLCTRRWNNHWLPWRLGSFLHWCYQAGLIRIAGISYQLRHRELQDYLARNPVPRSAGLKRD
jgi:hypothetical protein